jgi:hypothetical protein
MGAPWTPGPWVVTTCMDYWIEPANAPKDGQFHGIALCGDVSWPDSDEKQPQWEANARLIAAAPDLAEALDGVLQAHSNLAIHMAVAEHSRDPANIVRQSRLLDALDTACDTARAALSKARGETP